MWDKQTGSFLPSTLGLGMHVEIKDPDSKVHLYFTYIECLFTTVLYYLL